MTSTMATADDVSVNNKIDAVRRAAWRRKENAPGEYNEALITLVEQCDVADSPSVDEDEKVLMVREDGTMYYTTKESCRRTVLGIWNAWFGGGK